MQHELLREIRLKISAGTATEEELKIWEEWTHQPRIDSQQFVSEEEIEQRLRIEKSKPSWEAFLEKEQHNLIRHEEAEMPQPAIAEVLYQEPTPVNRSRVWRVWLVRLSAAIIIGLLLSVAAWLLLGNDREETEQVAAMEFTTLHAPRGTTLSFTLPDGTKVWLNTNTMLRYPKQFTGDTRSVTLNGEAYFEVMKNEDQPFIVQTENCETKVLGTSFNVDAYNGAAEQRISLLTGSVLVGKRSETARQQLMPGQQSILSADSFSVIKMRRPEDAIVWKKDSFAFDEVPLTVIMEKLAQFYNFKVKIDKDVENKKYTIGSTARTTPVIEILKGMERTNGMKFYPKHDSIVPGETITILKNE